MPYPKSSAAAPCHIPTVHSSSNAQRQPPLGPPITCADHPRSDEVVPPDCAPRILGALGWPPRAAPSKLALVVQIHLRQGGSGGRRLSLGFRLKVHTARGSLAAESGATPAWPAQPQCLGCDSSAAGERTITASSAAWWQRHAQPTAVPAAHWCDLSPSLCPCRLPLALTPPARPRVCLSAHPPRTSRRSRSTFLSYPHPVTTMGAPIWRAAAISGVASWMGVCLLGLPASRRWRQPVSRCIVPWC